MNSIPNQEKTLSKVIELTINTIGQKEEIESDEIKFNLGTFFKIIGESMPKNRSELYKKFTEKFIKIKE